ncbi:hypothetical protein RHMOL_Rhmol10G0155700 [Rhododendron molle]|nr:hypothetical protein RHMOL_Rhmol10G0155700 [Rhododendron molle]
MRFKILQWGLQPILISDHCLVMILDDNRDWGPKPFRFLDIWLFNPNCLKVAEETWNNVQVTGWAGFILQKMRAIKDRLKVWNKEEFGDINCALAVVGSELNRLDVLAEERQLTPDEKAVKCKSKTEFWRLSKLLESLWRQKSRVNWLKLGDKNTRFFQAMANNKYKRNMVGSIVVNGRVLEEPLDIKEATVEYFSRNFFEERVHKVVLEGEFPRTFSRSAALELEKEFEEGEIVATLKGCRNLKAPGPVGFNFSFVKKEWMFMKTVILQFFLEFHENAKLTQGINSTFVALIPKVDCPSSFREYRPLSMVGWIYKILSKVLANRLRVHIPTVIGEEQAAFIGGKQFSTGFLLLMKLSTAGRVKLEVALF